MDANFGKSGSYNLGVKALEENGRQNVDKTLEGEEHPSCGQNTKHYFEEFLNRTTIHGFNYLGERGRTIPEKIWWLVIIVAAFYLCITQIAQTYDKWMNSPVIVTFATTQTPIWEIPFPAVTVCPEIKSRKSIFNYTDVYLKKKNNKNVTEDELREFEYITLICSTEASLIDKSKIVTDERALDFLSKVSPDMKDMFMEVQWVGKKYKGKELRDLFVPMLTSEGICFTFNLMDRTEIFTDDVQHYSDCFSTNGKRTEWSVETGYSEDSDLYAYPRRTLIAGAKGGLSIQFFTPEHDIDYVCGDSLQGYKISLHSPTEIPRLKQKYLRIPLDQSVVASIRPNMMTTADELVSYKPEHRKCYFSREKDLKYFKIYTQENCLLECFADYMLDTCGCVGFQLPRFNSTAICGPAKKDCIEQSKADFLKSEVQEKIKLSKKTSKLAKEVNTEEETVTEKCSCLPGCNSLDFDVESSQCDWNWRAFLEIESQTSSWNLEKGERLKSGVHISKVQLFFKDNQFITSERNELYGQTEFWANCGGLMGLFAGFSFISFFEILYYLTLRLFCNLCKFGRYYWSGSQKLLDAKEHGS